MCLGLLQLSNDLVIVTRVADHSDSVVVLGCSPQQSDASDVDVLYSIRDGDVGLGDGFDEGVQVADDHTDHVELLAFHVSLVGGGQSVEKV